MRRTRKVGVEMNGSQMSDEERAKQAQERLMKIPRDQLGPAGRILFDNPRSPTPEQQRAQFRGIDGDGSGDAASTQLAFLNSVGDGG